MYFLLNLSHYVKSYGHFCQILGFFTMPTYQIWSCHVTQEANFEKFLSCPNSTFNIGKKSQNFQWKISLLQKLSAINLTGGGKHTPPSPVPLGLSVFKLCDMYSSSFKIYLQL